MQKRSRIRLHRARPKHAASLLSIIGSKKNVRYLVNRPGRLSSADEIAYIRSFDGKSAVLYAVCLDGKVIGSAELNTEKGYVNVGILLDSSFWGKGIGGYVVKRLLSIMRRRKLGNVALARIKPENNRSVGLFLRQGFTKNEKSIQSQAEDVYILPLKAKR